MEKPKSPWWASAGRDDSPGPVESLIGILAAIAIMVLSVVFCVIGMAGSMAMVP